MIINTFFHELLPWGGQTKFEFVLKLDRARLRGSNLISPIILWKDNECVLSCALSSTQYCSDSYLIGAESFLEKHFLFIFFEMFHICFAIIKKILSKVLKSPQKMDNLPFLWCLLGKIFKKYRILSNFGGLLRWKCSFRNDFNWFWILRRQTGAPASIAMRGRARRGGNCRRRLLMAAAGCGSTAALSI